jgi:penicillin-binding protein 1B
MSRPQRPRRRGGPPRRKRRGVLRSLLLVVVALALAGAIAVGLYAVHLSDVVRVKFEGKRWAVPAQVYGRPLELYAGAPVTVQQLTAELERLGYRKHATAGEPATWSANGNRIAFRTRPFRFWDGEEPSRSIEVRLGGSTVERLTDTRTSTDVALFRLEAPLIGSIYPSHKEDRVLVRADQLPEPLLYALYAVEDRNFRSHFGVDPKALLRASFANLRAGRVVQGGSTLTQQLVKNFFLTEERTLWRKLNEALMAVILELRYSKDEILEAYANEIYLGQDGDRAIHGFGLASYFFFGRPVSELDVPRAALLAGMIRGPSLYDPRRNPERAKQRRDLVIDMMVEEGFITPEEAKQAKAADLGLATKGRKSSTSYPAFVELVRRQLRRDYREEDLTSEGLRIYTTLDPWLQDVAEKALDSRLTQIEKERKMTPGTLEGAVVVASPQGGEVLAVVGTREAGSYGFNRALDAVRPIGSLVKPAVYLAALSDPGRFNLLTPLEDTPVSLKLASGTWSPENYDKRSHGTVSLQTALAQSYNLATVRLGLEVGLPRVAATLKALGVERPIDVVPALLLGSASLAPVEVTQYFQGLAAGGFRAPLRTIREVLDASSKPLQRYPLTVQRAADPAAVYLVSVAMQEVVNSGTARGLLSSVPPGTGVAGKTGTTDGLRDSWFAGFTGDMVAVVWVGRDDNKPTGLSGASGALRVWAELMKGLRPAPVNLTPPDTVGVAWVDAETGLATDADCPSARRLPVVAGYEPPYGGGCGSRYTPPPPVQGDVEPSRQDQPASQDSLGDFLRRIFR